jgi:L-ascorbate metabolism protein UlaG (beta-lactamase superfamily)
MKLLKVMKISLIVSALIGVTIMTVNCLSSSAKYRKGDIKMNTIKNSPQYKNGKFRNDAAWKLPSLGQNLSTMWKVLFSRNQRTPKRNLPVRKVNLEHFNDPGGNQLNVTWLGHSSLMVNIDGYKILLDPVFSKRVSFFGPSRYNGDVPLDINKLREIDVVIVSHNHYDHLNKFSIKFLNKKTKKFMVPLGVGAMLERWGVPRNKIVELDWWDEYRVDKNLLIAATPSQHFSGRGLSDRDETLWASWVIKAPHHKIFFSGDSGYFNGFKEIGEKYGPFDMTFLECGAYNEKWHHIHMYPEETVQAHIDLKGKILHPIHWATFNLSLHPWYEPMRRLATAAALSDVKTAIPMVGETTVYNRHIPSEQWWELPAIDTKQKIKEKRSKKWHKKNGTAKTYLTSQAG